MLKSHRQILEQQIFLQMANRELREVEKNLAREVWQGTERERQIRYIRAHVAKLDEILNRAEICQFQRLVEVLSVERDAYRNLWAGLLKQTEETSLSKTEVGTPEGMDAIFTLPSFLSPEEIDSIINPSPKTRFYEFLHGLWRLMRLWFSFTMEHPEDEDFLIQIIDRELRNAGEQFSTNEKNLSDGERQRAILQAKILVCEMGMEAGHYKENPAVALYAWREKLRYESELGLLETERERK